MDVGGGKGEFLASIMSYPGCQHVKGKYSQSIQPPGFIFSEVG